METEHNQNPYEGFDGTKDIVAERLPDGRLKTNVRHKIVKHSPTGMEIGYAGSGPADFALNCLIYLGLTAEQAQKNGLYQDFKFQFVAGMDQQGDRIKYSDAINWLTSRAVGGVS